MLVLDARSQPVLPGRPNDSEHWLIRTPTITYTDEHLADAIELLLATRPRLAVDEKISTPA